MFARKPNKSEILLCFGNQLRLFLFGLQCKLDVELYVAECERAFSDAETDKNSPKQYTFYNDRHVTVTGQVDDYEPESIWIIVNGPTIDLTKLNEQAHSEMFRMRKANGGEYPY